MADRNAIEIGIGLRADDSQLAGDLARIKAKVENTPMPVGEAAPQATKATKEATESVKELGDETKKAGDKGKQAFGEDGLGGTLRSAKKKFGEQIEVVQGLIGKFMAVGAIAGIFYNIGKVIGEQIVDKLETAAEKAANFSMTVDRSDAKGAIKQISVRVAELNAEIADTDSVIQQAIRSGSLDVPTLGISRLFQKDRQKLIEERTKLVGELQGLSNRIGNITPERAFQQQKGREAIGFMEQMQKLLGDANKESARDDVKIFQEAEEKKLAISAAFNKLTAEQQKAIQQDVLDAIAKIDAQAKEKVAAMIEEQHRQSVEGIQREADEWQKTQEQLQDFNDGMKKWAREQQEAADKVRNDWVKSLQDIRQEINATFGQESANSLTQFSQQLQVQTMQTVGNFNRIITEGVG